jgi:hypothetical protein
MLGSDPSADMSGDFNTPLSAEDEAKFQQFIQASGRQKDLYNYDLRGAWKADAKAAGNGHLPDTWKKPNHPTFSEESQYSSPENQGGRWIQLSPADKDHPEGTWAFQASSANLKYQSAEALKSYFGTVEKGNTLVLPQTNLYGSAK